MVEKPWWQKIGDYFSLDTPDDSIKDSAFENFVSEKPVTEQLDEMKIEISLLRQELDELREHIKKVLG